MKLLLLILTFCVSMIRAGDGHAQALDVTNLADPVQKPGETASLLQSPAASGTRKTRDEPFGSNLFRGGFRAEREDGVNPDYVVSPGDAINLRIWGAVEINTVSVVDPQGNIFIPGVGPVKVGGTPNRLLNDRVTAKIKTVFFDNVSVYTSLEGTQPVAVFVTGYVTNPGRFAGIPSNSALYFLDRAGGVDAARGSYRDIRVIRNSQVIAKIDLYDFLREGVIRQVQFKDGDTIVVGTRGSTLRVTGDVNNPAIFEFMGDSMMGADIIDAVLLKPGVTYVGVSGVRQGEPFSKYVPLDQFKESNLLNGDRLYFRADTHDDIIVVDVEGFFQGPSRFAVPANTRLPELLDHIPVNGELTDTASISIKRRSIASRQLASLENSLNRLEARYLTAPSQTDAEAAIRAQEAKLIKEFVDRARKIRPNGRLVVAGRDGIADVVLQNGDVITIPTKSESVLLSGEVLVTQAMLFQKGTRARDYIERSGGFSKQADEKKIVLIHSNGEVTTDKNPLVRPGDEIIVLPRVPVKSLQIASVIVDILYKIAVAASVAVAL